MVSPPAAAPAFGSTRTNLEAPAACIVATGADCSRRERQPGSSQHLPRTLVGSLRHRQYGAVVVRQVGYQDRPLNRLPRTSCAEDWFARPTPPIARALAMEKGTACVLGRHIRLARRSIGSGAKEHGNALPRSHREWTRWIRADTRRQAAQRHLHAHRKSILTRNGNTDRQTRVALALIAKSG